jgi:ribosomal protein L40E
MAKFAEAQARLFDNRFVCRRCHGVTRATMLKILASKITCRKCGYKRFKPKRKK